VSKKTLYWYDFESFGANARRDRASQFAGIRTDEDLAIIGEPLVIYCKPTADFLPDPMACLITGITPQEALSKGLTEREFISQIHEQFSQPDTCVVGYNSLRFDDELTRQLLYRNFYDPYEREWRNGNSRWDIIDMLRLCAATRPEGITWPKKEDGSNSFRLEELTVANGITHEDAHDALADVIATIEMARLVKKTQPKLYRYLFQLRNKKNAMAQIDLANRKPLLHVSMMYPATLGCLALVMPLCRHPENSNGIIVYDLREDPASWLTLSVDEIRARLYTPKNQLPEGVSRIPLKTIHINRCPVIASPAVLSEEKAREFSIDFARSSEYWQLMQSQKDLESKVAQVFCQQDLAPETDPDFMIYSGGFFNDGDKRRMQVVRSSSAGQLANLNLPFSDSRLEEMMFRYRARNYPDSLNSEELVRWQQFCAQRLQDETANANYENGWVQAQDRCQTEDQGRVLAELSDYISQIKAMSLQQA